MDTSRDLNLEKQIDAYIKGRLTESEAENLWVALLKRPDYIDMLETELSVKLILEEQLQAEREKEAGAKVTNIFQNPLMRSWKWLATAAAIAILVIAINFLQLDTHQTIRQLTLGEINMVENLASPEVLRSQKTEISDVDSLLNIGFKAAISGDVQGALEIYKEVVNNYNNEPAVAMAYLNMGIINYNSESFENASLAFKNAIQRVVDDAVLEEKAYWYLGNAYIHLGQLEEAREAIHSAYSVDGMYRKPALRLLQKLDDELGNIGFDNFEEQIKEE